VFTAVKPAWVLAVAVLTLAAAVPAYGEHGGSGGVDASCTPDGHVTLTQNVDALSE
jgi:hypothetical protein